MSDGPDQCAAYVLFIVAIEVRKCRAEGIVTSDDLANVGSVMGSFPSATGGALQFVYSYGGGAEGFLARAAELADVCGDRFDATSLVKADVLAS